MDNPREMTLANFKDGALEELFRIAMRKAVENIDDPNTDHKQKRTVTLKITLAAQNEERDAIAVAVESSVKLAAIRPVAALMLVGRSDGQRTLVNPLKQEEMFSGPKAVEKGA